MCKKEYIREIALGHAKRGVFDNSACVSGLERNFYNEVWMEYNRVEKKC